MRIGIVASSVQVQESGGDVTPDAVNWDNITAFSLPSDVDSPQAAQTITGITQSIVLEVTFTSGLTLEYQKNGGSWTAISNGGTISVSNNNTLKFQMTGGAAMTNYTVTVKNQSSGNTTLDTFTVQYVDI